MFTFIQPLSAEVLLYTFLLGELEVLSPLKFLVPTYHLRIWNFLLKQYKYPGQRWAEETVD